MLTVVVKVSTLVWTLDKSEEKSPRMYKFYDNHKVIKWLIIYVDSIEYIVNGIQVLSYDS